MTTVMLFGGQGSQRAEMFTEFSALPAVREHIDIASEVLAENAWELDQEAALAGTRAVQLALLMVQTGVAKTLQEAGLTPAYGAGHSLGAWSAAVVAGALDYADAVRLVELRGTGMAQAAPNGFGMSAVIGLSEPNLAGLISQLSDEGEQIWLSNLNSASQITASGSAQALTRLAEAAGREGAQRVVRLKVSVPAHSPMMTPAREALERAMDKVKIHRPQFPLLANITGRMIRTADQLRRDLVFSTDQPVSWSQGIAALSEREVNNWIQISPGNNLVGLLRDVQGEARSWCVDNVGIAETIARSRR